MKYIFLMFFCGCASLVNLYQKESVSYAPENTYCPTQLPHDEVYLQGRNYWPKLKEIITKNNLNFPDQVVLLALYQMNDRPDASAPTSRLQFVIDGNYFDYYSKDQKSSPYLYALNQILKKYRGTQSLEQLAFMLDQLPRDTFRVGTYFHKFLQNNSDFVFKSKKNYYVRGEELIYHQTPLPRINFKSLIQKFRKTPQKVIEHKYLFPFHSSNKVSCNYDLNIYQYSQLLLRREIIPTASFGLQSLKQYFMGISSQTLGDQVSNSPFFQGTSHQDGSWYCKITQNNSAIHLFSALNRDPGQTLFSILSKDLKFNFRELDKKFKQYRTLYLNNPSRILYESFRANQEDFYVLLKKYKLPIYHVNRIGLVWGHLQMGPSRGFVRDDRYKSSHLCKGVPL